MALTDNHEFDVFEHGAEIWEYNREFEYLDKILTIRDEESEIWQYVPFEGARFIATDTGTMYDGDGFTWSEAHRQLHTLRVTGALHIPELDHDPDEGSLWIRSDL